MITLYKKVGVKNWKPTFEGLEFKTKVFKEVMAFLWTVEELLLPDDIPPPESLTTQMEQLTIDDDQHHDVNHDDAVVKAIEKLCKKLDVMSDKLDKLGDVIMGESAVSNT